MANIKLMGAKFLKVSAERNPDFSGKVSMTNNIKIISLEKLKDAKDALETRYLFEINFGELGKVIIEGILYLSMDSKAMKDMLKSEKEKNIQTPEYMALTNLIIRKASIKAFELEEEMGLPIHIKLPSLSAK